jgi:PIN domain nuclease of toxin-antitoxin system
MDYLLDTHALLWAMFEPGRLSPPAREVIADASKPKLISITSLWEIATKNRIGKLPLLHRDPFDGILAATAMVEKMTIITADTNIQKYNVSWIW